MTWLLYVLLGVLLLVISLAGAVWDGGIAWFQLILGVIMIGLGIERRRRSS